MFLVWTNIDILLYQNTNLIGTASFINNLYRLDINASFNESCLISKHGTECKLTEENSAMLWKKHLELISKQRIERLISNGILDSLDLIDFKVCVKCIKRKQTNVRKLVTKRSSRVLN